MIFAMLTRPAAACCKETSTNNNIYDIYIYTIYLPDCTHRILTVGQQTQLQSKSTTVPFGVGYTNRVEANVIDNTNASIKINTNENCKRIDAESQMHSKSRLRGEYAPKLMLGIFYRVL